jgi:adenosylcobyric acid synthase
MKVGMAKALMIQGTCSNTGKSLLVAGLCRAFTRRGLRVRPFKPQNMSNNAAVTVDGGEIGRAQALQARACGVQPVVDMNPVLLKPQSDTGAQVVVQGRVLRSCTARDYHALKPHLLPAVLASFARLKAAADLVLVEGAGSPAEVNLRAGDIANMGFARAAGVPVVLVGDIERGGVIAQLVGTALLLEPDEQALLRGYLVNKFRGDPALFDEAHPVIQARTGLRSLGVVTWFEQARDLPKEDMLGLAELAAVARGGGAITVAVPRLPRLANFDDLDPLAAEPDVDLRVLEPGQPVPAATDLVLLPGSKATLADLAALRAAGWDIDILAHARRGGWVLGLCGGYQMLGRTIADPEGVEGAPAELTGLGLLAVDTVLAPGKTLATRTARDVATGEAVRGYEIHMGRTDGPGRARPMLRLDARSDGAVSSDGRVMGCYLHGLLAADGFRRALLARIRGRAGELVAYEARVEAALDGLAQHLERCLDLDRLLALAGAPAAG